MEYIMAAFSAASSLPQNNQFFLPRLWKAFHNLGRRNYMFAGSHKAAQRAAMMYSFFGICKLHGVNPQQRLTDVLNRLPDHSVLKLDELLPNNWKPRQQ